MDASAEIRAVLDAARLRAEGVFSPVSGEGEDKLVETTVSAEVNLAPCSLRDLVAWADAELCAAGSSNESEPVLPPLQSELGRWALWQVQGEDFFWYRSFVRLWHTFWWRSGRPFVRDASPPQWRRGG